MPTCIGFESHLLSSFHARQRRDLLLGFYTCNVQVLFFTLALERSNTMSNETNSVEAAVCTFVCNDGAGRKEAFNITPGVSLSSFLNERKTDGLFTTDLSQYIVAQK